MERYKEKGRLFKEPLADKRLPRYALSASVPISRRLTR